MQSSTRIAVVTVLTSAVVFTTDAATVYASRKIPGATTSQEIVALNNLTQALANRNGETSPIVYNWANGNVADAGVHPSGMPAQSASLRLTALDFNESMQIVGFAQSAGANGSFDSSRPRAFVYSDGSVADLSQVPPFRSNGNGADDRSSAVSINNSGDVTGWWSNGLVSGQESDHGFLYSHGSVTDLGTLDFAPRFTQPAAINNRGQIAGISHASYAANNPAPVNAVFLYDSGRITNLGAWSTLPGYNTGVTDMNDAAQIIGSVRLNNHLQACFVNSGGQFKDLGRIGTSAFLDYGCSARDINNAGLIVGTATAAPDTQFHAFIYDGSMRDLNSLIEPTDQLVVAKVVLQDAVAINDRGEIVAKSSDAYYLLTPVISAPVITPPTPTPTPTTPTTTPPPAPIAPMPIAPVPTTSPPTAPTTTPTTPSPIAPTPIAPVPTLSPPSGSPTQPSPPAPTLTPVPTTSTPGGTTTPPPATSPPTDSASAPSSGSTDTPISHRDGGAMDTVFLSLLGLAFAVRRRRY